MGANRFDTIARVLVTETTRRRPLAALLGGTLAVLGLAQPDDGMAATGTCKPKCGTCQQCKKGEVQEDQARQDVQEGEVSAEAERQRVRRVPGVSAGGMPGRGGRHRMR